MKKKYYNEKKFLSVLPLVLSPLYLSPNIVARTPSSVHLLPHLPPYQTISLSRPSLRKYYPPSFITIEVSDLISRTEKVSYEEARLDLPPNQGHTTFPKLILLAKLITNKDIGLAYVRDVVLKAWNPIYPLEVKRMDKDIFMFSFSHEVDAYRAYHKRPWSYKGGHLILKKWSLEVTWQEVEFSSSTF